MKPPADMERRLLFILHRGLVEARLLAQAGSCQQLYDLADAIEPIPSWIACWRDEYAQAVRLNLETYAAQHPNAFRYAEFLDEYEPPPF